jgi:hypothetical protein
MRIGRALSTLPRGAVAGVAAAPAPLGVSATVLCVRSLHRLLLVTTIVALCVLGVRLRGLENRTGGTEGLDTPKVFCHPRTNFR